MPHIDFPDRQSKNASETDRALIATLAEMLDVDETITFRSVARRMNGNVHASSLVRDNWRSAVITRYQEEQLGRRRSAELVPEQTLNAGSVWEQLSDLSVLRHFMMVSSSGNIGTTSRELGITQPTLTRQMQALEAQLNAKLFVRHGKGVSLTIHGLRLQETMQSVKNLLAHSLERHVGNTSRPSTPVVIAVVAEAGRLLAGEFIDLLRQNWPSHNFRFEEAMSASIESALVENRILLGLSDDSPMFETLEIQPLFRARLGMVVAPSSYHAVEAGPVPFRALGEFQLILPSRQSRIRRRLDRSAFQSGVSFGSCIEVDSLPLRKQLVHEGRGVTILPAMSVSEELARGALVFRDIVTPTLVCEYSVLASRTADAPASEIVKELSQYAAERIRRKLLAGAEAITNSRVPD